MLICRGITNGLSCAQAGWLEGDLYALFNGSEGANGLTRRLSDVTAGRDRRGCTVGSGSDRALAYGVPASWAT